MILNGGPTPYFPKEKKKEEEEEEEEIEALKGREVFKIHSVTELD